MGFIGVSFQYVCTVSSNYIMTRYQPQYTTITPYPNPYPVCQCTKTIAKTKYILFRYTVITWINDLETSTYLSGFHSVLSGLLRITFLFSLTARGVDVKSCSYFNSNTFPLKVVFNSAEDNGGLIQIIYKVSLNTTGLICGRGI